MTPNLERLFTRSPIIPVMVIQDKNDALPIAQALLDGGIDVFEITLRTEAALESIRLIADHFPQACVGAGTVLNVAQFDAVVAQGAQFVISPGFTTALLSHAAESDVPLIPGVATASEMMTAQDYGFQYLKFFPAEANGGVKALKALTAPIQGVRVCPTGGVTEDNMNDYLAIPGVTCVGGSWILPDSLIRQRDWAGITQLTQRALAAVATQ